MIALLTTYLRFASRQEIWFYNGEKTKTASYTVYLFPLKNPPGSDIHELPPRKSVRIDLRKDEHELFGNIHPTFRYDIERGKKENPEIQVSIHPTKEETGSIMAAFSEFARSKNILPLKKRWLDAAAGSGNFCVTKIRLPENGFVSHIYLHDDSQAILTQSFNKSTDKEDVSRGYANKYLHWHDMMMFKKMGIHYYDFGGINPELKGITNFKLSFGGDEIEYRQYVQTNFLFKWIKGI